MFKSKFNLENHLKNAKSCLSKRGVVNDKFKCKFCEKVLTTQTRLSTHLQSCKEKIKNDMSTEQTSLLKERDAYIVKLEAMIENLQNTIADIAKQPKNNTSTTNNSKNIVINNMLDLSKEKVESMIENHLTPKVIGQGQVGLALMTYEHLLKDENGNVIYKCVDPSRQIFEYVNKDGDVVKDVKATKLIGALIDSKTLSKKTIENAEKLWTDENGNIDNERFNTFVLKSTEITNLESENSKFRGTLTSKTI
jgi:predicted phage tail protein